MDKLKAMWHVLMGDTVYYNAKVSITDTSKSAIVHIDSNVSRPVYMFGKSSILD